MRYLTNPLKLLFPALLAFLLSAQAGSAQNSIGFMQNSISGWNDTVYASPNTVPVGGLLRNYANVPFYSDTHMLVINGYVDTGSVVPFSIPYHQLNPQLTLMPGDSAFLIMPFIFDSSGVLGAPQFHVGNNVVVVWPIGVGPGNWQSADSIMLNVFIIDTISGTGPENEFPFLRIYPVPANGPLYISSYNPQHHMLSVIIRDASGRTVYDGIPTSPIETDTWAPGLYVIEAALSNGTVSWYKIMRQ
jgi:hypothetical protein